MVEALLSFNLSSDFAIFRDESITTSHTSYVIPSKTTIIGLIAAILGITRKNSFKMSTINEIYSKEYLELFKNIKIGIKVLNNDILKTTLFTNNVSLKENKTKPFKKELLTNPKYNIFIFGEKEILNNIYKKISNSEFKYTPFLGNAYCIAKIRNPKFLEFKRSENLKGKLTSAVIIDSQLSLNPTVENSKVVIENHLHLSVNDNNVITRKTLNFWIPIGEDKKMRISKYEKNEDATFLEILDWEEVICVY